MDPATQDPVARALAYAHPAWMATGLLLAAAALRAGLALRRARATRRPPPRGARRRHLRAAKPAVALLCVGFAGGIASAVWLRGMPPLRSFHAVLGVLALALFAFTARQGFRLEHGDVSVRELHARLGASALLLGLAAAIAGFVLLP
ncbi:MAG TPA: DUF4079 family protein [Myxococcota bacterium]|nr:DUF4079 family protein [Myxococcota bacterium]